jgi:hypothetical protein
MRGGSQASLITTTHGHYVVKWWNNPQHRRILINEVISSELLRYLGISGPPWACIHADQDFLGTFSQLRFETSSGYLSIEPGWHFGSRYPGDPELDAVYDFLPASLMPKVENAVDFLKTLVFDAWVDNRDNRQAVFTHVARRKFRAHMIDNGHTLAFEGNEWRFGNSPVTKTLGMPVGLDAEELHQFGQTVTAIQNITREDLNGVMRMVPPEWMENDEQCLSLQLDQLIDRGQHLDELMSHLHPRIKMSCHQ